MDTNNTPRNWIALLVSVVLMLVGAVLILPGVGTMPALQIQAGLGNSAPLQQAWLKIIGGLICVGIGFWSLGKIKY